MMTTNEELAAAYNDYDALRQKYDALVSELVATRLAAKESQAKWATRETYVHNTMVGYRGIVDACVRCGGWGVCTYGNTSTWRSGIGGNALTNDVCDRCWGSGDEKRPWPSRKRAETRDKYIRALAAEWRKIAARLERDHEPDVSVESVTLDNCASELEALLDKE